MSLPSFSFGRLLSRHKVAVAYLTEVANVFKAGVAVHQGHHFALGAATNFDRMMITVLGFDGDVETIF